MRATGGRDSTPETALRRAVHALGLRYRVDVRPLPALRRKADLVFRSQKVAVFLDGCFWHGCKRHCVWPKQNARWWRTKILGNRRRDGHTDARLRKAGWRIVRIWEHESPLKAAQRVLRAVVARQAQLIRDLRWTRARRGAGGRRADNPVAVHGA